MWSVWVKDFNLKVMEYVQENWDSNKNKVHLAT